jgi:predicted amidohydrolase YtcJ
LLPVKVSEYVTAPKLISSADAGSVRERFPLSSPEDRMRIAGIKIFIDGGVSASLAAVLEPYVGTQNNRGQLFFTEDEVSALVRDCAAADLQLIAHTMGERAQRLLCAAAERVPQRGVVRAEHGGVFMTEPATLDRFIESGVLPVPNAVFLYTMCDFIPESVGPQALRGRLPLRTMADRGVVLAGSSDSAGSELRHANPFFGIWCAVARTSFRGDVLEPEQAISVDEALYMHTAGAAAAGGQAATKGALEVGKAADVVILNTDPRALPADDLLAVHPDYVFVDGQQRYAAT